MNDVTLLDISNASRAIAEGKLTSRELTEACLDRIERWQPSRNCFIRIDRKEALESADARDRELKQGRSRGALHGIPLAHKDLFCRKGRVSTAGSSILKDKAAATTATVLDRLDAAGAIDLGTLNMSEFAAGPTGHNIHFGHCRNAFNPDRIAGGSSSGSASAVGARLVFGALGSDTGASIRLPAAFNGVVGLKPTYGRISRAGVLPRSWSLDHIGPLARTARDCATIMQAISGHDPADSTSTRNAVPDFGDWLAENQPLEGLRIGFHEGLEIESDEVRTLLLAALRRLEDLGARIVRVPLPDFRSAFAAADTIIKCEAASLHGEWFETRANEYSNSVRFRIEAGTYIPAPIYIDALRLRAGMTKRFMAETMSGIDMLFLPVAPVTAPKVADMDMEGTDSEALLSLFGSITLFTRPFNFYGLPAASVPAGFDSEGLPVGFQLVAAPFDEKRLLQAADAYQQHTDHHQHVPAL